MQGMDTSAIPAAAAKSSTLKGLGIVNQ